MRSESTKSEVKEVKADGVGSTVDRRECAHVSFRVGFEDERRLTHVYSILYELILG